MSVRETEEDSVDKQDSWEYTVYRGKASNLNSDESRSGVYWKIVRQNTASVDAVKLSAFF